MTKLTHKLQTTKTPEGDFSKTREQYREGIMESFDTKQAKPTISTGKKSFAGAFVLGALVLGIVAGPFANTSLSAQQVLAQGQEAIASQNNEEGRYLYTKERITSTFNGKTETLTVEHWEDTESETFKSVTTNEAGEVVDTFIVKDGKSYFSNTFGEADLFDFETTELADDEFVNLEGPNFEALDLSNEELMQLSPAEIDALLIEAGEEPFFSTIFEEDDPFYSLNGDEFEDLSEDEQQELIIEGTSAVGVETVDIQGFEKINKVYEKFEELRNSNDTASKQKLLQEVAAIDDITLTENGTWEGMSVYGIGFSDDFGNTTLYIEQGSFRYVGSESSFADGDFSGSFNEVILEESSSNTAPDFNTDGLQESDDFGFVQLEEGGEGVLIHEVELVE